MMRAEEKRRKLQVDVLSVRFDSPLDHLIRSEDPEIEVKSSESFEGYERLKSDPGREEFR
jgi:hypothetical protein